MSEVRYVELASGRLDLATGATTLPGGVRLSRRECRMLALLARAPGVTVAREAIEAVAGVEGPALTQAIRRLRLKVEPDPQRPIHLISVFNQGLRFEPLSPAPTGARGLPVRRAELIGRADDRATVEQALLAEGLCTLTGPGGVGKTALALRIAHASPRPRRIYVDASAARTAPELVGAIVSELAIPGGDLGAVEAATGRVAHALASAGPALLVLDNVEQLADAAGALVARLRADAPGAAILLTSRVLLPGAPGAVVRLAPLPLADAIALWNARARAVDAEPCAEDDPELVALLHQLDRLPLAIELAAARARTMRPAAMLARIGSRFRLLAGSGARDDERHASLRATLAWSWALLPAEVRVAMARLAVFPAPAPADAAAAVIGADAEAHLAALCAASFVSEGPRGYDALVSVRAFARDSAEAARVRADAELAHARFYAGWVRAAHRAPAADGVARLDTLDTELPNLLAVARVADRDPDAVAAVAIALYDRTLSRGPLEPYEELLDAVIPAAEAAGHPDRGLLRLCRATVRRHLGRLAPALEDCEAADAAGGVRRSRLDGERGSILTELGRFPEALAATERSLATAERPMDRASELVILAGLRIQLGEPVAALEGWYREAVAIAIAEREPYFEACFRGNFGVWLFQRSRHAEALAELEVAAAALARFGSERRAATVLLHLAAVWADQGRFVRAEALVDEADAVFARFRRPRMRLYTQVLRAELRLAEDRASEALPFAARAEADALSLGDRYTRAHAGMLGAVALARLGAADEARAALDGVDAEPIPASAFALAAACVRLAEARAPGAPPDALAEAAAAADRLLAAADGTSGVRLLRGVLRRARAPGSRDA